jgi:hypothetical protein
LLEVITNLEEIREIITRPNLFHSVTYCDSVDDYEPNPRGIYFNEGNGLVWYEPYGLACEMFSAVTETPRDPVKRVHAHWRILASLGFVQVYAIVNKDNLKSSIMCRACGMKKTSSDESNIYKKVIHE